MMPPHETPELATTTCPEHGTLGVTLLYKMKMRHLFTLKQELTSVAPTVSEHIEGKLAYEQIPVLHPGFSLFALYKEFNFSTLFKSDVRKQNQKSNVTLVLATGKRRKGRTKHRDGSL